VKNYLKVLDAELVEMERQLRNKLEIVQKIEEKVLSGIDKIETALKKIEEEGE